MKGTWIFIGLISLALLIVFGLTCLSAVIFMLLWNWILPLFGIIKLTFWQSWGAIILLGIVGSCFKSKNYNDIQNKLDILKEDLKKIKNIDELVEDPVMEQEEVKEEKVSETPSPESSEKPKKPSRKRKSKKAEKQSASPTL